MQFTVHNRSRKPQAATAGETESAARAGDRQRSGSAEKRITRPAKKSRQPHGWRFLCGTSRLVAAARPCRGRANGSGTRHGVLTVDGRRRGGHRLRDNRGARSQRQQRQSRDGRNE